MSPAEHRIVRPFQFGETRRKKLKHLNTIDDKQRKELEKEGGKKGFNTSDAKEVVQLGR